MRQVNSVWVESESVAWARSVNMGVDMGVGEQANMGRLVDTIGQMVR